MTSLSHKQNDWLEPMQNWLKSAQNMDKIASDSDLFAKKVCAKEIFGSNLRGEPVNPYLSALRAAESVGKIPESSFVVGDTGLEPVTFRTSIGRSSQVS